MTPVTVKEVPQYLKNLNEFLQDNNLVLSCPMPIRITNNLTGDHAFLQTSIKPENSNEEKIQKS